MPFEVPPLEVPVEVVRLFEKLALKLRRDGWKRYSARAIMHRIRWHFAVEKGQRDFKCNNNWTAGLSRWCMKKHPELEGFFETRERRAETDDG